MELETDTVGDELTGGLSLFEDFLFDDSADEDENSEIDVTDESYQQQTINVRSSQEKELIDYLGEGSRNQPIVKIVRLPVQSLGSSVKRTIQVKSESNARSSFELQQSDDGPHLSRNAINARENRRKKKLYIKNLETQNAKLLEENQTLKRRAVISDKTIKTLKSEIEYFKGVIANQSTLSKILGTVQNIPGLKFQSSFSLDKAKHGKTDEVESQNAKELMKKSCRDTFLPTGKSGSKRRKIPTECENEENSENVALIDHNDNEKLGGVCLHVSGNSVSLEFCEKCSNKASVASSHNVNDHTYGRNTAEKWLPEKGCQNVG